MIAGQWSPVYPVSDKPSQTSAQWNPRWKMAQMHWTINLQSLITRSQSSHPADTWILVFSEKSLFFLDDGNLKSYWGNFQPVYTPYRDSGILPRGHSLRWQVLFLVCQASLWECEMAEGWKPFPSVHHHCSQEYKNFHKVLISEQQPKGLWKNCGSKIGPIQQIWNYLCCYSRNWNASAEPQLHLRK